ncbi:hypothetical protein H5410_034799, partial [Solanum commersonii]
IGFTIHTPATTTPDSGEAPVIQNTHLFSPFSGETPPKQPPNDHLSPPPKPLWFFASFSGDIPKQPHCPVSLFALIIFSGELTMPEKLAIGFTIHSAVTTTPDFGQAPVIQNTHSFSPFSGETPPKQPPNDHLSPPPKPLWFFSPFSGDIPKQPHCPVSLFALIIFSGELTTPDKLAVITKPTALPTLTAFTHPKPSQQHHSHHQTSQNPISISGEIKTQTPSENPRPHRSSSTKNPSINSHKNNQPQNLPSPAKSSRSHNHQLRSRSKHGEISHKLGAILARNDHIQCFL